MVARGGESHLARHRQVHVVFTRRMVPARRRTEARWHAPLPRGTEAVALASLGDGRTASGGAAPQGDACSAVVAGLAG